MFKTNYKINFLLIHIFGYSISEEQSGTQVVLSEFKNQF